MEHTKIKQPKTKNKDQRSDKESFGRRMLFVVEPRMHLNHFPVGHKFACLLFAVLVGHGMRHLLCVQFGCGPHLHGSAVLNFISYGSHFIRGYGTC